MRAPRTVPVELRTPSNLGSVTPEAERPEAASPAAGDNPPSPQHVLTDVRLGWVFLLQPTHGGRLKLTPQWLWAGKSCFPNQQWRVDGNNVTKRLIFGFLAMSH